MRDAVAVSALITWICRSCGLNQAVLDHSREGAVHVAGIRDGGIATLVGPAVKGVVLTQLGYDIRKPRANILDPRGSHCGAGAPMTQRTRQP